MNVRLHAHAPEPVLERGAAEAEVVASVAGGETFPAKYGRFGFRRNFRFQGQRRGKSYTIKQIEAYAVREGEDWLVVSVVVEFF